MTLNVLQTPPILPLPSAASQPHSQLASPDVHPSPNRLQPQGVLAAPYARCVPASRLTPNDTCAWMSIPQIPVQLTPHLLSSAQFSSVQFSHPVVSDPLQPHGLWHARPPSPSPTPGTYSYSCRLVGDAIQPSHPLSSPSPPASESFPVSQFFKSGSQSIGVSTLTSALLMNTQDGSPLG